MANNSSTDANAVLTDSTHFLLYLLSASVTTSKYSMKYQIILVIFLGIIDQIIYHKNQPLPEPEHCWLRLPVKNIFL